MYVAVFAFGAIVGSFLNVLLFRKNTGESVMYSRSRCFLCGKKLSWFELIPILSFIIQRGKCRPPPGGCGSKISWQYPVVELTIAILSLTVATRLVPYTVSSYGLWLMAYGFYFSAFCSLFLIAAYDFKHKIIDRHFLYIFAGFSVAEFVWKNFNVSTTFSAGIVFLFFYSLWRFSGGRWMGRGDADLAFFLALFVGFPLSLFGFLGAFWIGAIVGIFLLLAPIKKFTIKSEVPFGPF